MSDNNTQGIVPTIITLKAVVDELDDVILRILEEHKDNIHFKELSDHFYTVKEKMELLPATITRSYELIQMVIKSIHSSRSELKKSVDGLLKKTGAQLQKITATTEDATNKILDIAEKLDEEQMEIIKLVEALEAGEVPDDKRKELFDQIKNKIYQNQDSAFTIMDYLQFQDITAQQIAGAYALLSDTERTLIYVSDMLKRFDTNREQIDAFVPEIDENSFNADAKFQNQAEIQDAIDDLFSSGNVNVEFPDKEPVATAEPVKPESNTGEQVSNDDINALFNEKKSKESSEVSSQDDIDALFGNKKKEEEKTSQEDIDKLFS